MTTLPFDRRVTDLPADAALADRWRKWRERLACTGCVLAILAMLPQALLLMTFWTSRTSLNLANQILVWWSEFLAPNAVPLSLAATALAGLGQLSRSPRSRAFSGVLMIAGCVLSGLMYLTTISSD